MPEFTVVTRELVEGVYRVRAESREEAVSKFAYERGQIDFDGVEQVEYGAFEVEVRHVYEAGACPNCGRAVGPGETHTHVVDGMCQVDSP